MPSQLLPIVPAHEMDILTMSKPGTFLPGFRFPVLFHAMYSDEEVKMEVMINASGHTVTVLIDVETFNTLPRVPLVAQYDDLG